jgi:hypothetical protein
LAAGLPDRLERAAVSGALFVSAIAIWEPGML